MNGWSWLKPTGDADTLIQNAIGYLRALQPQRESPQSKACVARGWARSPSGSELRQESEQTRLQQISGYRQPSNTWEVQTGCLYGLSSPAGREVPRAQGFLNFVRDHTPSSWNSSRLKYLMTGWTSTKLQKTDLSKDIEFRKYLVST